MPSLRDAHIRHAAFYLHRAQSYLENWQGEAAFEDWQEFEKDMTHLRAAWEWVSQKSGDSVLTLAYAALSWELVDIIRGCLSKALLIIEDLRRSSGDEKI